MTYKVALGSGMRSQSFQPSGFRSPSRMKSSQAVVRRSLSQKEVKNPSWGFANGPGVGAGLKDRIGSGSR